jgi:S-formylglutathione hydrolase FrmB
MPEPMPGLEPMPPWSYPMAGRLEEPIIDSQALTGNPLGDPHRRPMIVQLPPAYDAEQERRFPAIYVLQGLTNQVDMWRARRSFQRNPLEVLDARFASGEVPPAIVVYVDAWTSLGGSQFVDSPGTGRYGTYLADEVVPFVDASYRTLATAAHRGLAGHSSGGYGAMVNAMRRPDVFGGLASHAGDGLFELCFIPEFGPAVKALRDRYEGSYERFWADFRSRPGRPQPSDGALLNMYCMAACFSADADGAVRLPFDLATGQMIPEVWDRWLTADPVRMALVPEHAAALRGLRAIWLDAGRGDEFNLDLATIAFHRAVVAAGVPDDRVHVELFDGGHSNAAWRYPLAIAWLADRLGE